MALLLFIPFIKMDKFLINIGHSIKLIYTQREPTRYDRLKRVCEKLKKVLTNSQLCKIESLEDHKGELTVTLSEKDFDNAIFRNCEMVWETEHEYNIKLVIDEKLPF